METNNMMGLFDQMKDKFNNSRSQILSTAKNDECGVKQEQIEVKPETVDPSEDLTPIENLDNQKPAKRTRRRVGNKSILQSAIARKEKSLEVDDQPSYRQRRTKKLHPLNEDANSDQYNGKKSGKSPRVVRKRIHIDAESANDAIESERRKSPRAINSGVKNLSLFNDEDNVTVLLTSRLCKCAEDKRIFMKSETDTQFCTALDSVSDKFFGCSRLVDVRTEVMLRPSTRIPYGVFCESHKQRLNKHNCCPTCGVFCTQGSFLECPARHHFHKDCKLSINQKDYCPHCGSAAALTETTIEIQSANPPVFIPVQRSQHSLARITLNSKDLRSNLELNSSTPLIPPDRLKFLNSNRSVELNECNQSGLQRAVERRDISKVAAILELGNVDLKEPLKDYNNGTFLHLAAMLGSLECVYVLVANQVDIDALDSDQSTALMLAISEYKNEVVKYLVSAGADLNLKGLDGMTSLHIAAKSGNLIGCKLILEATPSRSSFVNIQDDGGWTPLVWACEHGHVSVVKYLIVQGAEINTRDVEHNTALHWAAFKGTPQIIEFLLDMKTEINATNVHGDTPLHICAREDHFNCVIILMARGANVEIVNKNNETPLECAPKDGLCYQCLELNAKFQQAVANSSYKPNCLLTNDISRGRESNPIQCCNTVDSEGEPRDFVYIKKNCITSNTIKINTKVGLMQPCTCEDRCVSTDCTCAKLSIKCWYDEDGKLMSDFNYDDPPMLFECHDLCSCNSILCANRLVQKPSTQRFQLFKTLSKGWGVRSLRSIPTGNYVCEYIGEILTDSEAEARQDDSYLFDLDNKETESFCIDAKYYGNFARFINHSCYPNLHPIKMFIEHQDLRFPRIALFAKRDIAPNEELSFDYGDKFWIIKYKSFTCDCGADCCRYSNENIKSTLKKYEMSLK